MMIYAPHTFELSLNLLESKYEDLRSRAYAKAEGSHRIIKYTDRSSYFDVHVDEALVSSGIRVEYYDNFFRKKIKLIVNPSNALATKRV